MTAAMTPRPMSTSVPGAILKRLSPEPVSNAKMISSSTVVTMFTTCDNVTAAAMEPSSTSWPCR